MNQNNLFAYMASVVSQLKEERRMGTAMCIRALCDASWNLKERRHWISRT